MRLTVEENRDALRRYRHVKPAPIWGAVLCSTRCPETKRSCTLEGGHGGPHVAHGRFRRVVAVWDAGIKARRSEERAKRAGTALTRDGWDGGLVATLMAFGARVVRRAPPMEEVFLVILFLAMVAFAIEVAVRVLASR
jgi:hypothetical protein